MDEFEYGRREPIVECSIALLNGYPDERGCQSARLWQYDAVLELEREKSPQENDNFDAQKIHLFQTLYLFFFSFPLPF